MRDKDKTYIWLLPTSTCRFRSARPPGSTALALVRLCDIGAAGDVVWLKLGHLGTSDDRCCMTKDWSGVTDTRWTYMSWSPCSCFAHSMPVFACFCRWFYVAFLQTFWGIRHSPAQLYRGFRQLHIEFVRLLFFQAHRETDRFLQLQEFSRCKLIVECSTTAARISLSSSKTMLAWISLRRQVYVLRLI